MTQRCNYTDEWTAPWERNPQPIDQWDARWGALPEGIKRRKVRCPKCRRRMWSSIRICSDGCCIQHYIPAGHKVSRWWKPKPKRRRSHKRSQYHRARGRAT